MNTRDQKTGVKSIAWGTLEQAAIPTSVRLGGAKGLGLLGRLLPRRLFALRRLVGALLRCGRQLLLRLVLGLSFAPATAPLPPPVSKGPRGH